MPFSCNTGLFFALLCSVFTHSCIFILIIKLSQQAGNLIRRKTIKTYIKRSLYIVPTIALALVGLMVTGLSIAASKGEYGGWGHMGGKSCHHGVGHETEDYWGGKKTDMRMGHLAKVLDLTDAQKNAIKTF